MCSFFSHGRDGRETAFDRIEGFEVGDDRIDLSHLGYDNGVSTAATVEAGEVRLIYSASSDRSSPPRRLLCI